MVPQNLHFNTDIVKFAFSNEKLQNKTTKQNKTKQNIFHIKISFLIIRHDEL